MRGVVYSEWLRPWGAAGITAFLADFPVDLSQPAPEFLPPSAQKNIVAGHQSQARPEQWRGEHSSSPGGVVAARERAGSSPLRNDTLAGIATGTSANVFSSSESEKATTRASGTSRVPQMAGATVKSKIKELPPLIPVEEWPTPLQQYFSRLAPSPVLWCYEQLGEDIFGTSDPSRSENLKKLIAQLQFPKGTSVFWPPSSPTETDIAVSKGILGQAIELLAPKLIITIGSGQVLSLLQGSESLVPFTHRLVKGRMVVFLPGFDDLAVNTSLFNQTVLYLRAIISQLSII